MRMGWSFLKKYFCNMLSEFNHRGHLNKEINATFLTLILKVPNPVKGINKGMVEYRNGFNNNLQRQKRY